MLSHYVSLRSWVNVVMSVRNSASTTMFGSVYLQFFVGRFMSYLIWYNLTVLKVQTTVCGNVISIHAVCALFIL